MEPNLTQRPPGVDPAWWARIPWSTRRRIIDHHNRANRPDENDTPDTPDTDRPVITRGKAMPPHDRADLIDAMFEGGLTAEQVVDEMGVRPGSIVRALERAGRVELIAPFEQLRRVQIGRRAA